MISPKVIDEFEDTINSILSKVKWSRTPHLERREALNAIERICNDKLEVIKHSRECPLTSGWVMLNDEDD